MKNLLIFKSFSKGFTLVELLVVISIIAILGTIGFTIFATTQKTARDGKRIADLDAIAKSLESSRDFTTNTYVNRLAADFPNGIPTDPKGTTSYCISTSTTQSKIAAPAVWTSGCPTGWSAVSSTAFATGTKSWTVCAVKENNNTVECRYSIQQ